MQFDSNRATSAPSDTTTCSGVMRCSSPHGGSRITQVLLLFVVMLECVRSANPGLLDATAKPSENIYSLTHQGEGGHSAFNNNRHPQTVDQSIVASRGSTSTSDGPEHRHPAMTAHPAGDAVGIRITRPLNGSLFLVGDVELAFETRGFTPSVQTPIEVFLPQNGDVPALVESGNLVTISIRAPCTQVVTLTAIVRGQRASDSAVFSAIPSKAGVRSARVPLPPDAKWGGQPPGASTSRPNEFDEVGSSSERSAVESKRHDLDEESASCSDGQLDGVSMGVQSAAYGAGAAPPRPLSLVFVGSLSFDGQKFVWMQQMEGLPRRRFAPTYLTFQDTGGEAQDTRQPVGLETDTQTGTPETFEQRLRRACVPLVKISSPRVEASWSDFERLRRAVGMTDKGSDRVSEHAERPGEATEYIDRTIFEGPDISLREAVWKAVLDSIDRAGGDPGLMSPPWTRHIFDNMVQAIESVSPDILVVANARTLGDAVLTRAARWAMGDHGHIVMDFPNLDPAPGISADILAAPSHYVARHPALQAVVTATGAHVVVIPPGVSFDEPSSTNVDLATVGADNDSYTEGALCHPACKGNRGTTGRCDPACQVVGFAGRLSPEKSPGLFLMVAKHLAEMVPSAYFVIVGDGILKPALEAMADRLGITSRVHFTGWVGGTELQRMLRGVDLLFNPSLSSETFSIVNIESMAVATPVAAFGIGGMLEYLLPEVNAVVLDDPEPRAAAHEIAKVLLDPRRLAELGEKGREDVRRDFRADTALQRWAELYETLGKT